MINKGGIRSYLYEVATGERRGILPFVVATFFFPLSLIYGFGLLLLRLFYGIGIFKRRRLPVKVISIGNITLGGTGKTPLLEMALRVLKERGRKLGVLTRGYGEDEVHLLRKHFQDIPVFVGRDRIKSAQQALYEYKVDTLILDDGFQYWAIRPNLNIVLINSVSPFGRRFLLPAGSLREPISSLKRADVFVISKVDIGRVNLPRIMSVLKKVNPRAPIFESIHNITNLKDVITRATVELPHLEGKSGILVSGIADPKAFEASVKNLGMDIREVFRFPDHHQYCAKDIDELITLCKKVDVRIIITTEKDAVRMKRILKAYGETPPEAVPVAVPLRYSERLRADNIRLLMLKIELKILKEEELIDIISSC